MSEPRIIVVEDDREIRALLEPILVREGFLVHLAESGSVLDRLVDRHGMPDAIVLDLMLPGEDGLSICRRLRASSAVPIIMVTAKGEDIDRIVGLEIGADDYLPKPFNPRELIARIRAVLRRSKAPLARARKRLVGGLSVDLDARTVALDGEDIELTSAEFELLACFIERPNRVLSRDQLMDWTRGRDAAVPLDRTMDVQISRLRKKLQRDTLPDLFKTVRNAGYILVQPVEDA
jgi:two-component system OmpR family response regulator